MSKVRGWWGAAVVFALLAACRTPSSKKPVDDELARIDLLEDRRALSDGQLFKWAGDPKPEVRARALGALGRIQSPRGAGAIEAGLDDPASEVRLEAAFAAGVLGLSWAPLTDPLKSELAQKLLAAEDKEQSLEVQLELLDALGRLGTAPAAERLAQRLGDPRPVIRSRAALDLGIALKKGLPVSPAAREGAAKSAGSSDAKERFAGVYALAQMKAPEARPHLVKGLGDPSSEVRAVGAKGLGEVALQDDAELLGKALDDQDYRVAVEAARSLSKLAARCTGEPCPALKQLEKLVTTAGKPENAQVLLALAQQGLPPAGAGLLERLRSAIAAALARAPNEQARRDLAVLDCRLAAAIDRVSASLSRVLECGAGQLTEKWRLAMGLRELAQATYAKPEAAELRRFVEHAEPSVRAAAVEALGQAGGVQARQWIRERLADPDWIVAVGAALASAKLEDPQAVASIRALAQREANNPEALPSLAEALATLGDRGSEPLLRSWLESPHANVRHAAAAALGALTKQAVEAPDRERAESNPVPAAEGPLVSLTTRRGQLVLRLYLEDAPRTSSNFLSLAARGFYDGLTFHRVVPNFVVQGGDPRGDGEGGPGYSIRCEVNRRRYTRGVVGMALSGKDTGGSQFFITTSEQPHLDGRYTAFGEVIQGLELLDLILEGDAILHVRPLPGR